MRAVIEDRIHAGFEGESLFKHSMYIISYCLATRLYFGCRSAPKDQHYGTEWNAYAKAGKITYRVAFSRDGPEGTKRMYVQDLLRLDKEIVWERLGMQRGTLIISG